MKQTLFILCALCSLLYACKKDPEDQESVDITDNYMPVKSGSQWIYRVDSFVYDDNSGSTKIDTNTYYYKEVVGEKLSENEYELKRYYKFYDSIGWEESRRWTLLKNNTRYEKVQENTRYLKLLFPLTESKSWDGNIFNNKAEEKYKVEYFDQPFGNYPKTSKIDEFNEINLIEEIVRYEVYARDFGLVYALSDSLNTQVSGTRGYRYRITLTSYIP